MVIVLEFLLVVKKLNALYKINKWESFIYKKTKFRTYVKRKYKVEPYVNKILCKD